MKALKDQKTCIFGKMSVIFSEQGTSSLKGVIGLFKDSQSHSIFCQIHPIDQVFYSSNHLHLTNDTMLQPVQNSIYNTTGHLFMNTEIHTLYLNQMTPHLTLSQSPQHQHQPLLSLLKKHFMHSLSSFYQERIPSPL